MRQRQARIVCRDRKHKQAPRWRLDFLGPVEKSSAIRHPGKAGDPQRQFYRKIVSVGLVGIYQELMQYLNGWGSLCEGSAGDISLSF